MCRASIWATDFPQADHLTCEWLHFEMHRAATRLRKQGAMDTESAEPGHVHCALTKGSTDRMHRTGRINISPGQVSMTFSRSVRVESFRSPDMPGSSLSMRRSQDGAPSRDDSGSSAHSRSRKSAAWQGSGMATKHTGSLADAVSTRTGRFRLCLPRLLQGVSLLIGQFNRALRRCLQHRTFGHQNKRLGSDCQVVVPAEARLR